MRNRRRADRRRGPRCRVQRPSCRSLPRFLLSSPTAVVPIVTVVPAVESNGRRADVPALLSSPTAVVPGCVQPVPGADVQQPSCRSSPWSPLSSPTAAVPTCPPGADRRRAAVQPVPGAEFNGRGADVPALPIVAGLLSSRSPVPACNRRRADRRRVESNGRRAVPPGADVPALSVPAVESNGRGADVPTCRRADRRRGRVQRPSCRRCRVESNGRPCRSLAAVPAVDRRRACCPAGPAVDRRRVESNGRRAGVGGSSPTAGLANRRRGPRCRSSPGLLSSRSPLSIVAGWSPTAGVPCHLVPTCRPCRSSPGESPTAVVPIVAGVAVQPVHWCRRATATVPTCPPGADRRRAGRPAGPAVESNGRRADVPTWCRRAGLADVAGLSSRSAGADVTPSCRSSPGGCPLGPRCRRANRCRGPVQRPACRVFSRIWGPLPLLSRGV